MTSANMNALFLPITLRNTNTVTHTS